ncbi:GNAT family N-acetyltransferase [Thermicanus aegyptius]|uniref:GNAT family N-acetyltransferase n=1 Tax=Thermicanus aegyptius TaxID=94009 RepID=UPI000400AF8C|nr:GNAT family N-acetyltransferase [Thermicanus aegyptius]
MEFRTLTPDELHPYRPFLLHFLRRFGGGHITHRAIRWLKNMEGKELEEKGTLILIATEAKKLIGLFAVSDFGLKESLIAVHPKHRNRNLGKEMLKRAIESLGTLYGRVALDNLPSLKMCLGIGMVGFKLIEGPTGKPTLWLGIGQWKKEDVT